MIFVTVGTQWPFDRLIAAMDGWAAAHPEHEVFAQVFKRSERPRHMPWVETLSPAEFRAKCAAAEVIVAHAGIGTIMLALECGKRIVLLPRQFAFKEHLNDHQMETVRALSGKPGIAVAMSAEDLDAAIAAALSGKIALPAPPRASPELIRAVRDFINSEPARR